MVYEFGVIILNQNIRTMGNYTTWIQTSSLFIFEDVYQDIASNVEKRFDTSNYEVNKSLLTGKNKKVIGLMKEKLGGKIVTEFAALRPKTYSYLMDDGNNDKKAIGTKKCLIKQRLKFNDYKNCLLNNEIILK